MYDVSTCPLCGQLMWNGRCENIDCKFNQLKDGDRIISPIDNEVTEFMVDEDGIFIWLGKSQHSPPLSSTQPIFTFISARKM